MKCYLPLQKKNKIHFNRISLIIKFARLKKGLTQEVVAKKVGISTSYVTSIESSIRTSLKTAKLLLWTLGVNPTVCDDAGLYSIVPDSIRQLKSSFAVCAVFDMYCYSLSPDMVKELVGIEKEYIKSYEMLQILSQLSFEEVQEIFSTPIKTFASFDVPFSGAIFNEKEFNFKVIEGCLESDPFLEFCKKTGKCVSIFEYFNILKAIEAELTEIKFIPAKVFTNKEKHFRVILENMQNILREDSLFIY